MKNLIIILSLIVLFSCTKESIYNEIDIDITPDTLTIEKPPVTHYDTIYKPILTIVHDTIYKPILTLVHDTIIKPTIVIHNDTGSVTMYYAIGYTVSQPTCTKSTGSVTFTGLPPTWDIPTLSISGTSPTKTVDVQSGTYNIIVSNTFGFVTPAIQIIINTPPVTPTPPIIGKVLQPTVNELGSVELLGLPATGEWLLTKFPQKTSVNGTGVSRTVINLDPKGSADLKCYSTVYWFTVTNAEGCTSGKSEDITITSFN